MSELPIFFVTNYWGYETRYFHYVLRCRSCLVRCAAGGDADGVQDGHTVQRPLADGQRIYTGQRVYT